MEPVLTSYDKALARAEALAQFRSAQESIAIGDSFEASYGQRWEVVGFDRRHVVNEPVRTLAPVLASHCIICGEPFTQALQSYKTVPVAACPTHRPWVPTRTESVRHKLRVGAASVVKGGLPYALLEQIQAWALVRDYVPSDQFAALALPLVRGRRKAQKLGDTLRRMERRGQFPEGVTLTPTGFRFE